ncbi:MAG: glucose-1-phosphate thymidylyltransferase RfbA [Coriobacteriia bacterium]|nr:glucose-1-phosphate thymidylyltransferase RfbA [Coriobacteriia bacterium]
MKGILLAGGRGTRLGACTWVTSKQLLPVYDKPMIYHPLSTLMLAGIQDIIIVCDADQEQQYETLLGNGSQLGLRLTYRSQDKPRGIADALIVSGNDIAGSKTCLILGDNIFHGQGFVDYLRQGAALTEGAIIFGYPVADPQHYGVVQFDDSGKVISLEEKPQSPRSNMAVPGLYFYDEHALEYARELTPSARGELEITDLNKRYLAEGTLTVIDFGRGMAWLDTGSPEALLKASQYVETIQARQGYYLACIEEIAWRMGFITLEEFTQSVKRYPGTQYGTYIATLAAEATHD